jgi:lipopolysaccharide/colanic/teichoic acid biosynthesis glycosyltransferase
MRRGFDILFSLTVLILTFPLSLLIAIAVKLSSRGPVLFVQQRVGLGETVFMMYKFRSMRASEAEDGSHLTIDGDTRITNVGRVIRRLKLDELPQFINVLAGDMTIVGPRPEVPRYVAEA